MHTTLSRRAALRNSLGGLLLLALRCPAAQTPAPRKRLPFSAFILGPDYAAFRDAIAAMRANTNITSPASWNYWSNIHVNSCPHGIAYFLAWHRGYLGFFEQQLRIVSGHPGLALPYWDYYSTPGIPSDFLDPASNNPLYVPRTNSDVAPALTLAPFADSVTALPRGHANAYEATLEDAPHNPVHDIIGGLMADMQSPLDPIFWLHHANIDRLWSAWVAAGHGRQMPPRLDAYWNGNLGYSSAPSLPRRSTYDTRSNLFQYYYDNETLPTQLPLAGADRVAPDLAQKNVGPESAPSSPSPQRSRPPGARQRRPPVGPFPATGMRARGAGRLCLAGARKVTLDHISVSAGLPLSGAAHGILQQVLAKYGASPFARPDPSAPAYTQLEIVLEQPRATAAGLGGGYFYRLYLNLPGERDIGDDVGDYYLGTLGPFQLAGLRHHQKMGHAMSTLSFPATAVLLRFRGQDLSALTMSFVRVNGKHAPTGEVINIAECRIDAIDGVG